MEHKTNPFILKTKKGSKLTKIESLNLDLNIPNIDMVIAKEEINDKTPFTKVYYHDFDFLLKLDKPGLRLFCYVIKHLVTFNKDTIYLYEDDFIDKMTILGEKGANKDGFKDGVNNLLRNNLIAKSTKPLIYFINPNLFFRGERRFLLMEI